MKTGGVLGLGTPDGRKIIMPRAFQVYLSAGCLVLLVLLVASAAALADSFVEDFTTLDYCNTWLTTAWWDTASGEVKLLPFEIALVGSCLTAGTPEDVEISGDYAYVVAGSDGLHAVDISDPTSPWVAGGYDTPGYAFSVAIVGDYAYVADYTSGLQVVDIADPASPALAATYDTPGYAYGVAISGDHAFVADYASGLRVVDISDPTNPTYAGTYNTTGYSYDVEIAGDYAYVADYSSGLQVIDISDPANPTLAGTYNTTGYSYAVDISGDYAYIADYGSGLQVIDISDPTSPALAGSYDTAGYSYDVEISGDRAHVADHTWGLQVIDISDPTDPTLTDSQDFPGIAKGLAITGDYAYVADYSSGLRVIDTAKHLPIPASAGTYNPPGSAYDVAISGDRAYVASDMQGLQVIDISDPENPALAGACDTPGNAMRLAISGNYAFVADYDSGLQVIDISDPTNPTLAGACDTLGNAYSIAVSGDYAYVGDLLLGDVNVVDISDPENPALAATLTGYSAKIGLAVSGDYLLAAYGLPGGLTVIDIADPTNPQPAGDCALANLAQGVAVSGDYAYVATQTSGLRVIDISDPMNPTEVGNCSTPGWAMGVTVLGDRAYVANYLSGLQVIDITDPTNPDVTGGCDTPGFAYGVAISGDYAYVADHSSGLRVQEVFQRLYDSQSNFVRSEVVFHADEPICAARLSAAYSDSIHWDLSADGSAWTEFRPGASYKAFTDPGTDLKWRSYHYYYGGGVNPTCTNLEIEWLYESPAMASVTDIPNDQGRQVSLSWTRSGYDLIGSITTITEYALYRRIDYDASAPPDHGEQARMVTDAQYVNGEPGSRPLYPPGDWHFITTVPACAEHEYAIVVPTLGDSTIAEGICYTTFFVRALTGTPGVHFDSDPDSGYSIDNLAPAAPLNVEMTSPTDLAWEECPEEDFDYFTVYGSAAPELDETATFIGYTIGIAMDVTGDQYDYYHVTATDFAGNEGEGSSVGNAYAGIRDTKELPTVFALERNQPNPFDAGTLIKFDVPNLGVLSIKIYDAEGRLVKIVAQGTVSPGRHATTWAGDDQGGNPASPGIYFIKMEAAGFRATRKATLLR
jgi:hypothetical protein